MPVTQKYRPIVAKLPTEIIGIFLLTRID